ncbi:hypothetical protein K443DRAFT_679436 [Laccaria amethystina LaAM-08-1]|uniref:Unplaced genomic scaffold K443scaffold_98, whole genome shotgun sequence n=1 Tax=Laccaria amethystina LaAM-08-1 TaxID=1095629 RepID=A0A0C9XQW8_9AGAR|nr:hypothetical protein K443DRAFT_679436 [Laccaria amethystina LaAM-08-1]
MSFPNGLYTLRASPAAGYGGLYATGNGDNETVTVAPNTPPVVDRQIWNIKAVLGKPGAYTITLYTTGSTFGGHWFPKDARLIPEVPIITSEKSYEWYIAYKETPDVPDTITIQAGTLVGERLYARANDKNEVVVISVRAGPDAEVPYWQFEPFIKHGDL